MRLSGIAGDTCLANWSIFWGDAGDAEMSGIELRPKRCYEAFLPSQFRNTTWGAAASPPSVGSRCAVGGPSLCLGSPAAWCQLSHHVNSATCEQQRARTILPEISTRGCKPRLAAVALLNLFLYITCIHTFSTFITYSHIQHSLRKKTYMKV